MSEKLTNTGLVKHAQTMLGLPTSYMWGTLARKIDSGTIDWCRKTYPSMYSADRVAYLKKADRQAVWLRLRRANQILLFRWCRKPWIHR